MDNKLALLKAVQLAGTQQNLASMINAINGNDVLKQAHVWAWINKTHLGIPENQVISCSKALNYQVTPHMLRSDIYPYPDDGLPPHMRMQTSAQADIQVQHE